MATEVRNVPEESRYEIVVDGSVAGIAEYLDRGEVWVFHHTEIDSARRGNGLGAELVKAALDDVRTRGLRIIPSCWYVAEFVEQHPDYKKLLATPG
jgi:predicted GNAT family acetyltransferase